MEIANEFQRMRMAYDLYGFVRISNSLEQWQVDGMEKAFDNYYLKAQGHTAESSPERLPFLGHPIESEPDFLDLFASSKYVLSCLDVIAGDDCQYLGSDILVVYDDSIGSHRDTLYSIDVPKVLVCLSDCVGSANSFPKKIYNKNFAGSFAVMSGSHYPGLPFNAFSAQLSDWPGLTESLRAELSPHFLRCGQRSNGEFLYPYIDCDSRYQGYSKIPFKRGDVIIFSTRALHALIPTFSNHFTKLFGVLFIEGFSKKFGKSLPSNIQDMSETELAYITLPYNLRLADAITKGCSYETALCTLTDFPMGLGGVLEGSNDYVKSVFKPKTKIYDMVEESMDMIKQRVFSNDRNVIDQFHANFNIQRQYLNSYSPRTDPQSLLRAGVSNLENDQAISEYRDRFLSRTVDDVTTRKGKGFSLMQLYRDFRQHASRLKSRLKKRLIQSLLSTIN
ncbi:hypothetical protein PMIT1320_00645 [Prochlorococcus marinus str. MIT 1320]|nr:hypothetical protein PMIT1320_00645 [Prochlorococcus marinus str. MIT 1320]